MGGSSYGGVRQSTRPPAQQQHQARPPVGSPAYYAQFSQLPSQQRFGYFPTYQRQYPNAQPLYPNWGAVNTYFGSPTSFSGVQLRGPTPVPVQAQTSAQSPEYFESSGLASGGIVALAQGGQYLGGPTDGMADQIPANIEGEQEAALSHGEFVVPADVVADMGNGNNEAGAAKLYEMMERVRKARHGTTEQPPQINADKFLPR
jgi:hypothetical protein